MGGVNGNDYDNGNDNDNGNGNGNGCGTFDILCHIEKLKAQIGGVAIIGGVVLVGYFLLKRRIRK